MPEQELFCVYCGDGFDLSRDHVIPQSYLRAKRKSFANDWTVTACRECNSTLGGRLIFNVPERAEYLRKKYLKKYAKLLQCRVWDAEEIAELGYNMGTIVAGMMVEREIIYKRYKHLQVVALFDEDYLKPAPKPTINLENLTLFERTQLKKLAKKR